MLFTMLSYVVHFLRNVRSSSLLEFFSLFCMGAQTCDLIKNWTVRIKLEANKQFVEKHDLGYSFVFKRYSQISVSSQAGVSWEKAAALLAGVLTQLARIGRANRFPNARDFIMLHAGETACHGCTQDLVVF